jgi:serine/threonine protein kinase
MKSCPDCSATYPDDYAVCPKDGAPLYETSLWQIDTVVRGKYRILARLGEGGMAVVYKARHELLDELRALKVIKPELTRDSEFMDRFTREARMARKLNHPNAVRVDDLDIAEDGLPFIAMELVVGDTLKTLVDRGGALPITLVLDTAVQVCEALDAAHKFGLVHRDIKPENIFLVAQREGPPLAKIVDFGISRLREETAEVKGLTQTGMVIGTPEYMSPEQAQGKRGAEIDGRSDLYSLGVVMYRMLAGEMPFQSGNTVEMLLQHLKDPPRAFNPILGIPEGVSSIVMKALEKDPEKRFATGAEMAAAIRRVRGSSTRPSHKIDLRSVSSATATFATGADAQASAAADTPARARPPIVVRAAPADRLVERPSARKSARRARPRTGPARRTVLTFGVAAVLMAAAWVAWKYAERDAATPGSRAVSGAKQALPGKTPAPSSPGVQTPVVIPKAASNSASSAAQYPTTRNGLSYDEQARVVELTSLADIYYREGGCEKALSTYQKVLEIDPHNNRAYTAVQKCYSKVRSRGSIAPFSGPTTATDASPRH